MANSRSRKRVTGTPPLSTSSQSTSPIGQCSPTLVEKTQGYNILYCVFLVSWFFRSFWNFCCIYLYLKDLPIDNPETYVKASAKSHVLRDLPEPIPKPINNKKKSNILSFKYVSTGFIGPVDPRYFLDILIQPKQGGPGIWVTGVPTGHVTIEHLICVVREHLYLANSCAWEYYFSHEDWSTEEIGQNLLLHWFPINDLLNSHLETASSSRERPSIRLKLLWKSAKKESPNTVPSGGLRGGGNSQASRSLEPQGFQKVDLPEREKSMETVWDKILRNCPVAVKTMIMYFVQFNLTFTFDIVNIHDLPASEFDQLFEKWVKESILYQSGWLTCKPQVISDDILRGFINLFNFDCVTNFASRARARIDEALCRAHILVPLCLECFDQDAEGNYTFKDSAFRSRCLLPNTCRDEDVIAWLILHTTYYSQAQSVSLQELDARDGTFVQRSPPEVVDDVDSRIQVQCQFLHKICWFSRLIFAKFIANGKRPHAKLEPTTCACSYRDILQHPLLESFRYMIGIVEQPMLFNNSKLNNAQQFIYILTSSPYNTDLIVATHTFFHFFCHTCVEKHADERMAFMLKAMKALRALLAISP